MPRLTQAGQIVLAIMAALVALLSFRYILPHPPEAPANVTANPFARPWLPVHAVLSGVALLVGPLQFLIDPFANRRWHRWCGRVYVAACLIGAPAGLILASGVTTGWIVTAGFGSLAILWFAFTALAWQAALDRRFVSHRRWMIRSYALTFGAVMLRVYLVPVVAWHLDFNPWYRLISFAAWVPNLVLVEFWMRRLTLGPNV